MEASYIEFSVGVQRRLGVSEKGQAANRRGRRRVFPEKLGGRDGKGIIKNKDDGGGRSQRSGDN